MTNTVRSSEKCSYAVLTNVITLWLLAQKHHGNKHERQVKMNDEKYL